MLVSAWAPKKDGTAWQAWDVFPELNPAPREPEMPNESEAILRKFLILAGRQKVH